MDEKANTPDYLAYDDSGFCSITLNRPVTLASGSEANTLRMREPTVDDQIVSDEMKGSDGIREVTLFANLCEIAPDDIRRLKLKDYKRVQEAYSGFL
ncbi:phage tail assembly protein [Vreelandella janggokensis]|uniref:phage tail assembly protein n=1 Tax=Vreelandella janggokensis TaxID=370767 RepID=UPI00285A8B90|nr:phage tail assembly protein [Halomonas janggokensis]MDR5887570.1 phage tail assembly protein [Halomonas janggokensis]